MRLRHLLSLLASRGASTSPFGKLDGWMDGFRVERSVKAAFARKAASMTPPVGSAELLRKCMRVIAFGPEYVKSMHDADVDRVAGMLGEMLGNSPQQRRVNDS